LDPGAGSLEALALTLALTHLPLLRTLLAGGSDSDGGSTSPHLKFPSPIRADLERMWLERAMKRVGSLIREYG
jgi:hypothetical protein